jgi:hypothetical protein
MNNIDGSEMPTRMNKKLLGIYLYDVTPGDEDQAKSFGIRQLKSGKWGLKKYDTSGRTFALNHQLADELFGVGKYWKSKSVEEDMTPTVGKVSQTTGTNVTIDKPDGTKLVVPTNTGMLSKDSNGNLVLNKAGITTTQGNQQTGQQNAQPNSPQNKPVQPGQQVQLNNDIELESIKKLSGLK